ncbi:Transcriptional regulator, AbiEi antitoxin, Type IV TA system [Mucilaginibacter pineti]|uniref:Transcriptional regulator, AbiEi antitoxin, Type IV TA system n=1 Tax=Mucilaginibacter pineti TaxID=1391627 RepID=A0A1G7P8L4_9SPHI|nr:hypothetical protein [Mucilaginibacter pineti]SDF81939.1 Transcriptional regulator, AbiEi antitoxin, Type IV TA system [Mucilaginibacter pineti]
MDINQTIREYSSQPLTHQLMMSFLKDYKRPNDKIKALKADGIIETVKKGLYIAGPNIKASKPESGLLANHIYGPSYVSLETALSYYGLIPERVYEISSMTTKASKEFNTPAGIFTYTHLALPYYAFGLNMIKLSNEQRGIIASPEKALCDKIVSTSGILLRSTTQVAAYLLDDLRMDESSLKSLDVEKMMSWLPDAPKRDSLNMLIKMIRSL